MTAPTEGVTWRASALRYAPIALIGAGIVAFFALGLNHQLTCETLRDHREWLAEWVQQNRIVAPVAFVLIYAVVAALSLPVASLMSVTGGFIFGTVPGTALNVVAATIGASALFLAARTAFADVLRKRAGPFVQKMRDGFAANAFSYLLFLRLVPVFFFWLVNLVPALLGVRFGTFVVATFIGIIPGAFVYSNVGSSLGSIFEGGGECSLHRLITPHIMIAFVLLGCLSLVPVIYRKFMRRDG